MQGGSLEIGFSHRVVRLVHDNTEGVLEWTYLRVLGRSLASDYPP